jgi:polysaccharide deacetylase family sporulation protein PdaB
MKPHWIHWFTRVLVSLGVLISLTLAPLVRAQSIQPEDRYSLRDVATSQKALALTFDISWGSVMPQKVFGILVKDRVPATIFVSGPWAKQNADLVRAFAQAGMEVESHGWAHVNYSGLSPNQIRSNIDQTNTVIKSLTGIQPTYVRPPNGDFNRTSIRVAKSLGYTTVTWGTDSLDWMNPGVKTIASRVIKRAHPGDIVLLHASDTCKQTDLALPTIIQTLRSDGYQLVTLKTLMTMGTPTYRG